MSAQEKLNQILSILHYIKDDEEKLMRLLEFLEDEILEDEKDGKTGEYEDPLKYVPEKYRKAIREIADNMTANLISFFNPDTCEIEFCPKDIMLEILYREENDDDEDDDWIKDEEKWENPELKWENCITVEPLESHDSFAIMERFVRQLPENRESDKLWTALNGKKPFANFDHLIHNSKYREDWFAFRQKELEKYVADHYFRVDKNSK